MKKNAIIPQKKVPGGEKLDFYFFGLGKITKNGGQADYHNIHT